MSKGKIHLDKYYTSKELANYCINKTTEVLKNDIVTEVIEPSAGTGSFSNQLQNCIAYDIEPEGDGIIQQDFLELDMEYKKGRLFIGNPPFGSRMNLAQRFFKKCVELGDYIAFILPISQLDNVSSLFEFDLIHSEDLGKQDYSDRKLHCCFNIYRRPKSGKLNSRPISRLKDIKITRQDSKNYDSAPYDVRMCYWGDGTAGKILEEDESYAGEYKIEIKNKEKFDEVYNFITTFDWNGHFDNIAMKRIKQWQLIEVLLDNIDGIE